MEDFDLNDEPASGSETGARSDRERDHSRGVLLIVGIIAVPCLLAALVVLFIR